MQSQITSRRGPGGNPRFASIPSVSTPRSSFDRSHGHMTTFDAGYLIPIYVDEVLPGDTLKLSASTFARMATPLKPVMDQMYLDTFYFAVPLRLIWDNFQRFMGERDPDTDSSTDYLVPTSQSLSGGYQNGTLHDYMGIPTQHSGIVHNNLPCRAYNLIYNEWFRSEDLIDSAVVDRDDGPDDHTDYVLRRRTKRHDYFVSALPFAQKGLAMPLPLGISAPILGDATVLPSGPAPTFDHTTATGVNLEVVAGTTNVDVSGAAAAGVNETLSWNNAQLFADLQTTGVMVDLSNATAATINEIRAAFQTQKLLERDARGGTRYTEIVRSHFGVTSPDSRLQRPEYLGGGSNRVNVHPVPITAQKYTGTSQYPGELVGFATAAGNGDGFVKSFTEHCVVIGLAMVRANLTYQQGLHKMWSRSTRFDFYWPAFAHLGEQEVLSKEIFMQGVAADDDVFGYQERYAEYRYKPSIITGQFRSNFAQSLDVWHLAQDFSTRPVLNESFIEENPPIDRVIAVPSEPHFIFDAWFNLNHTRPMPAYSVPGLVDHF